MSIALIVAIVVPLAICALNAWLNIRIKFAKDIDEAKHHTQLIFFKVFEWTISFGLVGSLIWLFTLPLTKLSLGAILASSFTLFSRFIISWSHKRHLTILDLQLRLSETVDHVFKGDADLIEKHVDVTHQTQKEIVGLIKQFADEFRTLKKAVAELQAKQKK